MIYVGKHKTKNLNDGYMGSGKDIKKAIQTFGVDKFEKEVLYDFDHDATMCDMERSIVTETFIKRLDTYNVKKGERVFNDDTVLEFNERVKMGLQHRKHVKRLPLGRKVGARLEGTTDKITQAKRLRKSGLSFGKIGEVMGICRQRAHQLVNMK